MLLLVSAIACPLELEAAHSVAVMPFENVNKSPSLDWLSMGISETIATDLLSVPGLILIERGALNKVMDEQKLQFTGAIDPKTAVKVGKIVAAQVLVIGSFQKQGETIRLTARFVDTESGGVLQTAKVTGKMGDIFDLQDEIVKALATNLNIEIRKEEIAKLANKPTESLEAYRHFGQGALLQAKKDLPAAVSELKQAISIDPKFAGAREKFKEVFWGLEKGTSWTFAYSMKMNGTTTTNGVSSPFSNSMVMETKMVSGGLQDFDGVPAYSSASETLSDSTVGELKVKVRSVVSMYYIKDKDGICMLGMKSESWAKASGPYGVDIHSKSVTNYSPPQLMYPYQWKVGKEWAGDGTMTTTTESEHGGKAQSPTKTSVAMANKFRISGIERISLPSGEFESFIVEQSSNSRVNVGDMVTDSEIVNRFWFVPGPGAVKMIMTIHSIGNRPKGSSDITTTNEMVLKDYHLED